MKEPPVAVAISWLVLSFQVSPACLAERTCDGLESVKVARRTLTKDEGGRGVVLGGVGDSVGLASNDTLGWVVVDLKGEGSSNDGSARKDGLEETHVDGSVGLLGVLEVCTDVYA